MRLRLAFAAAGTSILALALVSLAPAAASAANATATYDVTLGGLRIGIGGLRASVNNNSYTATATVRFAGLARMIADGRGSATSAGALLGTRVLPNRYSISTSSGTYVQSVRMSMLSGTVRLLTIDPPPRVRADAIPVTQSSRRGVVDPVGALVMPVPGAGDMLVPASCNRVLPVFDGRQRYDIDLSFDRLETVKAADGSASFSGPVLVCKARYHAIAGHRPDAENVKALETSRDMEVWLAPMTGARVLVPYKIIAGTPNGRMVIAATQLTMDGSASQRADAADDAAPASKAAAVAAKRPLPQ